MGFRLHRLVGLKEVKEGTVASSSGGKLMKI
jgi:hypothetical protein